jgi:hypothetical protein
MRCIPTTVARQSHSRNLGKVYYFATDASIHELGLGGGCAVTLRGWPRTCPMYLAELSRGALDRSGFV